MHREAYDQAQLLKLHRPPCHLLEPAPCLAMETLGRETRHRPHADEHGGEYHHEGREEAQ